MNVSARGDCSLWTDKTNYKIGETVTIYFSVPQTADQVKILFYHLPSQYPSLAVNKNNVPPSTQIVRWKPPILTVLGGALQMTAYGKGWSCSKTCYISILP